MRQVNKDWMVEVHIGHLPGRSFAASKKDIHPVALNHSGELLLEQILNKGKCIVINDQHKLALFKIAAFAKIFDSSLYHGWMQSGLIKSVMQGLP